MASIKEVYDSVVFQIHTLQNGELTFADFNKRSKIAEIKMLGWLTGSPEAGKEQLFVTPYDNQKSRDWITPLIKKHPQNIVNGEMPKPSDYYQYENMYALALDGEVCAEDDEEAVEPTVKKYPIQLLQGQQFYIRANTFIKLLKPTLKKAISKEVGSNFVFLPEDLGSVELEYISYPEKYGNIVTKVDDTFNEEVIDEALTQNYIWGEWAVEVLSFFIVQGFSIRVRETALFQMNESKGKQP